MIINGEITNQTYAHVVSAYRDGESITLNSCGGDLNAALAIYDFLLPKRVAICATGSCHSAAVIILLAASQRHATPHCRFCIHPIEQPVGSGADEYEWRQLMGIMAGIISNQTGMSIEKARALLSTKSYFGAEEALELNIMNEVTE